MKIQTIDDILQVIDQFDLNTQELNKILGASLGGYIDATNLTKDEIKTIVIQYYDEWKNKPTQERALFMN